MTERIRVFQPEGGRLMTKQSDAMETDVNAIVARHVAHGMPFPVRGTARYGDFTSGLDFHASVNRLKEIQQGFDALPAHIRRACQNDPGEFLDICFDPQRIGELEALGLVESQKPAAVQDDPTPPADPPAEPEA